MSMPARPDKHLLPIKCWLDVGFSFSSLEQTPSSRLWKVSRRSKQPVMNLPDNKHQQNADGKSIIPFKTNKQKTNKPKPYLMGFGAGLHLTLGNDWRCSAMLFVCLCILPALCSGLVSDSCGSQLLQCSCTNSEQGRLMFRSPFSSKGRWRSVFELMVELPRWCVKAMTKVVQSWANLWLQWFPKETRTSLFSRHVECFFQIPINEIFYPMFKNY